MACESRNIERAASSCGGGIQIHIQLGPSIRRQQFEIPGTSDEGTQAVRGRSLEFYVSAAPRPVARGRRPSRRGRWSRSKLPRPVKTWPLVVLATCCLAEWMPYLVECTTFCPCTCPSNRSQFFLPHALVASKLKSQTVTSFSFRSAPPQRGENAHRDARLAPLMQLHRHCST